MILFWDIDGTLINNETSGADLYNKSVELASGAKAERPPSHHGKVDQQIIREYLDNAGVSQDYYQKVVNSLEHYSATYFRDPANARQPLPGIPEALTLSETQGFTNAIMTGNSKQRSEAKLSGAGFNLSQFDWDSSFFGSDYPNRPAMALAAATVFEKALIIGDTPGDGSAAKEAGYLFLAVCTGAFEAEDLTPHEPLAIYQNFKEAHDDFARLLERLK